MLRRLKKGNIPLKNFINSDIAKEKFEDRASYEKVVLYDEDTTDIVSDGIIDVLAKKLMESNTIVLLKGLFMYSFSSIFVIDL